MYHSHATLRYPHRQCNIGGSMSTAKVISVEVLAQFKYDEVNGGVIRVNGKGKEKRIPNTNGYIPVCVSIDSILSTYMAHRLVYLLHSPNMDQTLQIDHINGVRTDNRIENLRAVTPQHNQFNQNAALGCYWIQRDGIFRSQIKVGGKTIHLGHHETILDARASYLRAKKKYHIIEER